MFDRTPYEVKFRSVGLVSAWLNTHIPISSQAKFLFVYAGHLEFVRPKWHNAWEGLLVNIIMTHPLTVSKGAT